jgi:hypothetical protein
MSMWFKMKIYILPEKSVTLSVIHISERLCFFCIFNARFLILPGESAIENYLVTNTFPACCTFLCPCTESCRYVKTGA